MKKVYLAIPYSGMEESSFKQATLAAVKILRLGYNVYSPITHSHPLTEYDVPGDWEFWQKIDFQFIDWCDEVWVLIPEEGEEKVNNSTGVQAEIDYAKRNNKKVILITLNDLEKC
jgi:hypothetical protein